MLEFEWDERKNRKNYEKHGIWFEEARQVFNDFSAVGFFDSEHSEKEDRFLMLGRSASNRVLMVAYCERGEDGSIVRIFSARRATGMERKRYEEGI